MSIKNKITFHSQTKRIKNVNKHHMINYNKKEKLKIKSHSTKILKANKGLSVNMKMESASSYLHIRLKII